MLRKSFLTFALAALALTTLATTSTAVADTEEAMEYRQGVFKVVRWHFAPMGAMVQGDMDYDAELFARNAERLAALAPMAIEGFHGFEGGSSDAKAVIWEEWDTFAKGMENFVEESAKLAEVARSGDMGDIRPQFRNVALTCRGCHDDYRKD